MRAVRSSEMVQMKIARKCVIREYANHIFGLIYLRPFQPFWHICEADYPNISQVYVLDRTFSQLYLLYSVNPRSTHLMIWFKPVCVGWLINKMGGVIKLVEK